MTETPAPPAAPEEDGGWEERRLCSDESCIGVIGPDGRCKECGRPAEEGGGAEAPSPPAAAAAGPPAAGGEAVGAPDPEAGPAAEDDDWARRRLCSDESCIGVIGPDGRCKECGRPAEG